MNQVSETTLLLNPDKSIYHLKLLPEDIADTIILVNCYKRVAEVSDLFDRIELKKGEGEFLTHTGYIGKKRISVLSTGIGTANIDIVINELDALVNIDLKSFKVKSNKKKLELIRVGASETIHDLIPVNSVLISETAIGLDTLMHYYSRNQTETEREFEKAIQYHLKDIKGLIPYVFEADKDLLTKVSDGVLKGITITLPGYYTPQNRSLRAKSAIPFGIERLQNFSFHDKNITSIDTETSAIYGLARVLGHKALSVNAILANRSKGNYSTEPQKTFMAAIVVALKKII